MRFIVFLLLLEIALLTPLAAYGDGVREQHPNLVGGELGGRGGLASVNYERYLSNRFGMGIAGMVWGSKGGAIPIYISAVPVGNIHSLYLSAGATFFWDSAEQEAWPALTIGYQFQSPGGFFLRLSLNSFGLWPIPGVALGGSF